MIIVIVALIAVIIGLLYNLFINLYLIIKTPGELRTRSAFVFLGFLLSIIGIVITMRVGFSGLINPALKIGNYDVIFGSLICAVGISLLLSRFSIYYGNVMPDFLLTDSIFVLD